MNIKQILSKYDPSKITIAVVGSHSALDVCRGAKDLGFKTLVIAQKGREKVYEKYYKTSFSANTDKTRPAQTVIARPIAEAIPNNKSRHSGKSTHPESLEIATPSDRDDGLEIGCVDEVWVVEQFKDILKPEFVKKLQAKNVIFIPHRSFEVYLNDYDAIEKWEVPMFGNRYLLRSEERGLGNELDQYKIMDEAGIRYPKQFKHPSSIDRLCIVKVLEKERGFERAFFLVNNPTEFRKLSGLALLGGHITEEQLDSAVIEEFIQGVQVNFNFFFDPINNRLELLGTDTRRQTNLEGITKLPSKIQDKVLEKVTVKYEEAGHIAVTVLESMLEPAFELGEKFVKATQKLSSPGVIGPFGLQSMIIPGPPKKEIIVFDISPRMPGSPGIFATPYSGYLFGQNMSVGKRVAMQVKEALKKGELEKILT